MILSIVARRELPMGPMDLMGERQHHLILDAMRGVAAMGVVWFHLHFVVGYDSAGPLAVDFFFLLSGFVVASAYDDRLGKDMDSITFIQKRFVRMYPMFLVGLLLALAVQELLILKGFSRLDQPDTLLSMLVELFWIPSPFNREALTFPLDGPAWSLSFEILANIFFSLFHRHLTDRFLALLAVLSGSVVVAAVAMLGTANFGWSWPTWPLGLARVMFSFPAGVLLWRYRGWIPQSLGRIPPWLLLAALGTVLVLPESRASDILFLLVGAPLLVASGFRGNGADHAGAFRFLGEASYPLYALHGPTILVVQGVVKQLHLGAWALPIALGYLLAMLVFARMAALPDLAVRRALGRFLRRRDALAPAPKALIQSEI
jgi:peptidoglycan/LPS O-acetylase OafA/YrhL